MVTQPVFDLRIAEVAEICREIGVKRLELVGDAANGDFDPSNGEPEFVVEFLPEAEKPWMAEHTGLAERLSALYGLQVDLIATGSPYYSAHRGWIDATRTLAYGV